MKDNRGMLCGEMVLSLSKNVLLRQEDFGGLLFFRPNLGIFTLNHPAFGLLISLDGKKNLDEILGDRLDKFETFLKYMVKNNWLEEVVKNDKES